MKFGHLIDHSEGWSDEDNFTEKFKEFCQKIQNRRENALVWEDELFQLTRPIEAHIVALRLITPFTSEHRAYLRFTAYQPADAYIAKLRGYFMTMRVETTYEDFNEQKPIKAAFNASDPIMAVVIGSELYQNCVTDWINRIYVKVVNEK